MLESQKIKNKKTKRSKKANLTITLRYAWIAMIESIQQEIF